MGTRFVCDKMFRFETRMEQNPITPKGECLGGLKSGARTINDQGCLRQMRAGIGWPRLSNYGLRMRMRNRESGNRQ
jgi:hypothetical protein